MKIKIFSLAIFLLFIVTPIVAGAQGLVPCEGTECSACHFAQLGNTILQWLIGVLFVVFAVIVAVGGFGLVTSGGSPEARTSAKNKLINAFVGLFIVFAAWILVDTIMRGLLVSGTDEIVGYGPWSEIKCGTQTASTWPSARGSGFPPAPMRDHYFQFYEQDLAKNCKIPHSGTSPDQATCSSLQSAKWNSAAGAKYLVNDCDESVSIPPAPAWSTWPACGAVGSVCEPIAPFSPDPFPLTWSNTNSKLKPCADKFIAKYGGTVTSAFRPQAYQEHFIEIRSKWCGQGLDNYSGSDAACLKTKADVSAEINGHGLSCSRPVAQGVSSHTKGTAIDATGLPQSDAAADEFCFDWYGPGDPVHYTLKPGCSCN